MRDRSRPLVQLCFGDRVVRELGRPLEVGLRLGVRPQGGGPLSCSHEHLASLGSDLVCLLGCSLVGVEVVRRDNLDDLFLLAERAQVPGRCKVEGLPLLAGERVVGDLSDEILEEGVLAALRRHGVGAQGEDVLSDQRREQRLELGVPLPGHGCQPAHGECPAEDGCVLDEAALIRGEAVEPGRDQRLERLRHLQRLDLAGEAEGMTFADEEPAVEQHADGLDGVERDSLRPDEDAIPELCGKARDRPGQQRLHRLAAERLERDGGEVALAGSPGRAAVGELRPCEREQEERQVAGPVEHELDEVEQRAVGPVDVVEDEHGRPLLGHALEEHSHCCEEVLLVAAGALLQAEQEAEPGLHEPLLLRVGDVLLDRSPQLRGGGCRLFVLEDAGPAADHLGESPEGDAFPVREAAAPVPEHAIGKAVDVFLELPDEP